MNARFRRIEAALAAFMELAPADRKIVLEALRRMVSGLPLDTAIAQVCGDAPPPWIKTD